jgi:hypothetical protein
MSTDLNRRALLAGAASVPVTTIPILAAEPDPIFAAIERHKVAYQVRWEALEAGCDSDTDQAMCDADWNARDALLQVRPTTIAGVAALARYSWEFSQQAGEEGLWGSEGGYELHQAIAIALERMA